jgi:hypothetical protein
MPDELRLNSLSRYSKQSDEYTLEVHSHCEVPAGCGGVVLRWRNPRLSIPIEIWTYTTGEAQLFLDGNVPASARPAAQGSAIEIVRAMQYRPFQSTRAT